MKYLLLLLLGIVFIGCWEDDGMHRDVCISCPDSCVVKFFDGVYDADKVIQQSVKCDCSNGDIGNLTVKDRDTKEIIFGTTTPITSDMPLTDTTGNWKLGGVIESNTTIPVMSVDINSDGKMDKFHSLDEFLSARDKLIKKPKPIHDTIYIYRDTCATDYNKPGDYKIELHEAGVTTESGGLFLKPIRFIIANGYDDYAIRHSSTGKWEIYDCEKALEQWFIYDSTLKADNNIVITSKSKQ